MASWLSGLASIFSSPTDALQFMLGPVGWAGADEILDLAATALLWRVLGFHPLLLPTFVVELVPLVDMLPTWTGCVGAVIFLRKRSHAAAPSGDASAKQVMDGTEGKGTNGAGTVIDV